MTKGRGNTPDWTSDDFDLLWLCVYESVKSGNTAVQGCKDFCEAVSNVRTLSAARYKLVTKVIPAHQEEYEEAKRIGAQVMFERASQQNQEDPAAMSYNHSSTGTRKRRTNVVRLVQHTGSPDNGLRQQMTQRDLIKFLRNIDIVGADSGQVEQLQQQLTDTIRELDNTKNAYMLLQKKYDELKVEYDKMLDVFQIARKRAAGIDDTPKRMVINGRGELVGVEND